MLAFFIAAKIALSFNLFKLESMDTPPGDRRCSLCPFGRGLQADGRVDTDARISDRQLMIA
jgi:hypothetical protein